jgi:hypothetical protein
MYMENSQQLARTIDPIKKIVQRSSSTICRQRLQRPPQPSQPPYLSHPQKSYAINTPQPCKPSSPAPSPQKQQPPNSQPSRSPTQRSKGTNTPTRSRSCSKTSSHPCTSNPTKSKLWRTSSSASQSFHPSGPNQIPERRNTSSRIRIHVSGMMRGRSLGEFWAGSGTVS